MQNLLQWKQKDLLWKQNATSEVDVGRCEPPVPRSLSGVVEKLSRTGVPAWIAIQRHEASVRDHAVSLIANP